MRRQGPNPIAPPVARRVAVALLLLAGACSSSGTERAPLPPVGIEEGHLGPPLEGRLADGQPFRLNDHQGDGPTVLIFYRGVDCGLCRERLRRLGEHQGAYRELGARVVAVTPDTPEHTRRALTALGVELPVVSVDSATLTRWGVVAGADQPPLPATYLLDERGVIEFRHLGRDAGDRVGDATLIALLQQRRTAAR